MKSTYALQLPKLIFHREDRLHDLRSSYDNYGVIHNGKHLKSSCYVPENMTVINKSSIEFIQRFEGKLVLLFNTGIIQYSIIGIIQY